jgi:hypothetical protein
MKKPPTFRELLSFFYVQRVKGFETPTEPHMEPETVEFLTAALAKARFYVEYGSGGSTILADRMGVRTISVEGDPYYARAVRKGLKGSTVTILSPRIGLTGPWGYPVFRKKKPRRLKRWDRYVQAPLREEPPDLILVDGRFRVACALEAARFVRERGARATLIMDDYVRRKRYHRVEQYLGAPRLIGRAAVFEIAEQNVPKLPIDDIR